MGMGGELLFLLFFGLEPLNTDDSSFLFFSGENGSISKNFLLIDFWSWNVSGIFCSSFRWFYSICFSSSFCIVKPFFFD